MRYRDSVSVTLTPLLIRIGLAVTFMWAGFPKFEDMTFKGEDARTLIRLGAAVAPAGYTPVAPLPPGETGEPLPPEEEPLPPVDEPPPPPPEDDEQPPIDEPFDPAQPPAGGPNAERSDPQSQQDERDDDKRDATPIITSHPDDDPAQPDPIDEPEPDLEVTARQLHSITLKLDRAGHPYPKTFAWIAAITESVGGVLILIGLFSRVWAAGMAIAMVYAFYLSVLPFVDPAAVGDLNAWVSTLRNPDLKLMGGAMWQMMLFLSALAIFLGGPGPVSLDRLIFRPRTHIVRETRPPAKP